MTELVNSGAADLDFIGSTSKLLSNAAYLLGGVLFILALRGLSSQETARRGNLYGIIGMLIAIAATVSFTGELTHRLVIAAVGGGAAIGATLALPVGITAMPGMVALLHSFVRLAAGRRGVPLQDAGVKPPRPAR